MNYYPNFHVTLTDNINDVNNVDTAFDHYCLLFAGKLHYFGSEYWEKHALTQYKRFIQQCKDKNIKVTCKFIVYETDEVLSGHNCNRLSGFGDIYKSLFDTIRHSDDLLSILYGHGNVPQEKYSDYDKKKYHDIEFWLHSWKENNLYNCQLKKNMFEYYCKTVFDMADEVKIYYVDSNKEVLTKIQTTLNNPNIKSVYGFGQHFQVGTAYKNYPDMFDDCDDNTIVIKVRYDGVYFNSSEHFTFINSTEINPTLYKNVFYKMQKHRTIRNFFCVGLRLESTRFDIYQLPTVMYTRQRAGTALTELLHSFPHDISLMFNKAGILFYAKNYTDYIIKKAILNQNIEDTDLIETNQYLGFHIHTSLGDFFRHNDFNQIDYTPWDKNNSPINVFGATLREMVLSDDKPFYSDIYDDYKLRWYNGSYAITEEILKKFGKDNENINNRM